MREGVVNNSQLVGSSVETQSGQLLGRVRDFDLEIGTLRIIALHLKPSSLMQRLVQGEVLISAEYIIDIQPRLIIVDDAIAKQKGSALEATNLDVARASKTGAATLRNSSSS